MSIQVYQASGGGTYGVFPKPIISPRNPTTTDIVSPSGEPYQILQGWNNNLTEDTFIYLGAGIWVEISSLSGAITTLSDTTGTVVSPTAGNIQLAGTANQVAVTAGSSVLTFSLIGPYTPATYTAHGVLMGEGTSSIVASSAGTSGQVFTSGGASADGAYQALGVNSGLTGIVTANGASAWTANAVTQFAVLVGGAANAASSIAVGATGTVLAGSTGANPAFTASPTLTGTLTAATGLVVTTAGSGLTLPVGTASGATPQIVNARVGSVTFTGVSIAAAADLTLTLTNSTITGGSTRVMLTMSGSTTGSAPSIKSITPTAGSLAIVVTNGTGATTTTANITFDFIVLN